MVITVNSATDKLFPTISQEFEISSQAMVGAENKKNVEADWAAKKAASMEASDLKGFLRILKTKCAEAHCSLSKTLFDTMSTA